MKVMFGPVLSTALLRAGKEHSVTSPYSLLCTKALHCL